MSAAWGIGIRDGAQARHQYEPVAQVDSAAQVANEGAAATGSTLPAFVPVVEVSDVMRVTESPLVRGRPPAEAPARTQPSQRPSPTLLRARLPDGVTLELEYGGQDVAFVKAMIEALGAR